MKLTEKQLKILIDISSENKLVMLKSFTNRMDHYYLMSPENNLIKLVPLAIGNKLHQNGYVTIDKTTTLNINLEEKIIKLYSGRMLIIFKPTTISYFAIWEFEKKNK